MKKEAASDDKEELITGIICLLMKIDLVCGARPNFMKIAPLFRAINKHNASTRSTHIEPLLVHTGQHYDYEMSQIFFQDLELPEPDIYLGVGSGTHAEQTGRVMIEFERVLMNEKPDLVLVVGDVNSTLGAALTAVKLHIPVAHVEAGVRLFDKTVPEEVNRLLTDAVSDYLFTYSIYENRNLKKEGIPEEKLFFVGNVMVDSLLHSKEKAAGRTILSRLGLKTGFYCISTFHRPENVDNGAVLLKIVDALKEVSKQIPVIFPCHPRTARMIKQFQMSHLFKVHENGDTVNFNNNHIHLITPLGYLDFLQLMMNSKFVITDSGGIQEETTVLNIPCLTLRDTPDRPVTVEEGTNTMVGKDSGKIKSEVTNILNGKGKTGRIPDLWDGKTAERIIAILVKKGPTSRN
jgi:UDP-N-acetylglucosamine 2-epimerase (non-hydrolysing)